MKVDLINIGDKLFFMHHLVRIEKIFSEFHLVKVSFVDKKKIIYIDSSSLSETPNYEYSISIHSK